MRCMSLIKACWVHKGICYVIKNSEIQNIVHKTLRRIWEYDIPRDYNNRWLLKEDTLKNALYFHLRNQLGKLFDENDINEIKYIQLYTIISSNFPLNFFSFKFEKLREI